MRPAASHAGRFLRSRQRRERYLIFRPVSA